MFPQTIQTVARLGTFPVYPSQGIQHHADTFELYHISTKVQ
jgi:hypothetical protein